MGLDIDKRDTPEARELRKKLAELGDLEGKLGEKELELTTLRAELHAFEALYLRIVGVKYAELDDIKAKVAEVKLQMQPSDSRAQTEATQARARADASREATGRAEAARERFTPSDTLKQLYREVAKRIHPDLAEDDSERAKRQQLMAAANRAYETGDEQRLRSILTEWEESPESVKGKGAGAELIRVIRKTAQVETRIGMIDSEIATLKRSDLYALKGKVERAENEGRDLLAEMANEISQQTELARQDLERLLAKRRGL